MPAPAPITRALVQLQLQKSRRAKKTEAKVKVESAAVDAVTGKGPAAPTAQVCCSKKDVCVCAHVCV